MNTDLNNNKLPNILITGTPGVGKTSLSILLTDHLNELLTNSNIFSNKRFNYLNVGQLILDKKLYTEWNQEFNVPEFDEDATMDALEPLIEEGGCILDFHSAYFIPNDCVNLVVLLRCDNTILYDRLKARGYSEKKIKENIECEIMEVTADDVKDNFPIDKIIELPNEQNDDMLGNIQTISNKFIFY
jgi:adenylate kinase